MTEQTVKETIRMCKDRNILKEYLMDVRMLKKGQNFLELWDSYMVFNTQTVDV